MPLDSGWVFINFANSILLDSRVERDFSLYTVNKVDMHNLLQQDFPRTPSHRSATSLHTGFLKAQ